MIHKLFGCALLAVALTTPSFGQSNLSSPADPAVRSSTMPADFKFDFSIFSRNRGVVIRQGVNAGTPPVFIGALADQSGITGFLKISASRGASQIIAVRPGDTIPGYAARVLALSLDSIELARDGQAQHTVQVGHNLPAAPAPVSGR